MVLAQYLDYEVVDLVFLCILVQETSRKLRRGPVLSRFSCFSRFSSVGGRLFLAIPCFSIARTHIWAPLCSSPYRIVTNLYTINIEFYQLFCQTSVLYGRAIDFNFWAVPSL